jgi:carboxymethylenebutenolidase
MPCLDVQIPAADGPSNGTLHVPRGDGPWPGVLVYPDAGGVRETFRQMGDRLAGLGYVVLIPDIYYRAGRWTPFDVATLFSDDNERARMRRLVAPLTNEAIVADAGAYGGFLLARPEVTGSAIGTTGYCLGGRMSLVAATGLGHKIAAAASFHGGRLAVADDPASTTATSCYVMRRGGVTVPVAPRMLLPYDCCGGDGVAGDGAGSGAGWGRGGVGGGVRGVVRGDRG